MMRNIVIFGPTGSGKSQFAETLSQVISCGESALISADSRQVYRYMDIGTNKDKPPIKMQSIILPDQYFSVEDYIENTKPLIKQLNDSGNMAVIVGGTGFYITSLVYNMNFGDCPPNFDFREKLLAKEKIVSGYLWQRLKQLDPAIAKRYNPKELPRLIRTIEKLEKCPERREAKVRDENFITVFLTRERGELYEMINNRVERMIEDGLVDEVKALLKMGYSNSDYGLNGIGYREILKHLAGDCTMIEAVEAIKQNSRRYAKRQITWRRQLDIDITINLTEKKIEKSIEEVKRYAKN